MANFDDVRTMAMNTGLTPYEIDFNKLTFRLTDERHCINLLLVCQDNLLMLDQPIMPVTEKTDFLALLKMNNAMTHGAFSVDEHGWVVWRDTLELHDLQESEFAAAVHAMSVTVALHASELLAMAR